MVINTNTPASGDYKTCCREKRRLKAGRLIIVLLGIMVGQFILYGPSLVGQKVLLPLDILASSNTYLPRIPAVQSIVPHDVTLSDLVLQFETDRRFSASEIHAGRFPFWAPYQYAGAPFVWPKYSPFLLFQSITASPLIVAWGQMLAAIVAGLGFYLFCRRALRVAFWAAAIPAWCYPLTGFFVFWQGYPTCLAAYWLPWLLLAVHQAVRRSGVGAMVGLALTTCLTLVSGHIDVAGQALLVSGLYAVWHLLAQMWRLSGVGLAGTRQAIVCLLAGWSLGFLLAAPHLLPLLEYAHTGSRMTSRSQGHEDRPPVGLTALPQTVLPDMYGASRNGSLRIVRGNQIESSAATYAGILAALFVAPLAWCSYRHRSSNLFWCVMGFLGLSWCLNVPLLVDLLRLPPLNMMSHNRLVFATSCAILVLTAIGLNVLLRGAPRVRWWFWLPTILLTALGGWCVWRSCSLPEPIATQLESAVRNGKTGSWIHDLEGVHELREWFVTHYLAAATLCVIGVAGWLTLLFRRTVKPWFVVALGGLLIADLLWFASDRSAQCDPELYYPRIPVLEQVAKANSGRIIGYGCLPAQLGQTHDLRDIRGYDSIDPSRLMEVMALAADSSSPRVSYALTQWFVPKVTLTPPDGIRLSPVLDMLGVRYVIFRGRVREGIRPTFHGLDYWVLENRSALPRVFVPGRVETVTVDGERLKKLGADSFNPREIAYVETPIGFTEAVRGKSEIVTETPVRIEVSVQMETPGLVVLADLWDKGWQARLNGKPVPILRVNHAVRGVIVPKGNSMIEFRYRPFSLILGLWLFALASTVLVGGVAVVTWRRKRGRFTAEKASLAA